MYKMCVCKVCNIINKYLCIACIYKMNCMHNLYMYLCTLYM